MLSKSSKWELGFVQLHYIEVRYIKVWVYYTTTTLLVILGWPIFFKGIVFISSSLGWLDKFQTSSTKKKLSLREENLKNLVEGFTIYVATTNMASSFIRAATSPTYVLFLSLQYRCWKSLQHVLTCNKNSILVNGDLAS